MICESELLVLQKLMYSQNIRQTAEERFLQFRKQRGLPVRASRAENTLDPRPWSKSVQTLRTDSSTVRSYWTSKGSIYNEKVLANGALAAPITCV
jgi:hypothetical protein